MDIIGISSHGKDAVQFRVSYIKYLQVIVDPVWSPFFEKKRGSLIKKQSIRIYFKGLLARKVISLLIL